MRFVGIFVFTTVFVISSISFPVKADWQTAGNHLPAGGRIDSCTLDFIDIYPWAVDDYALSSAKDSIHLGTLEMVGVRCTWKKKNGGIPDLFSAGDMICPNGERRNPSEPDGCGDTSYVPQCQLQQEQADNGSGVQGGRAGNPIDLRNGAKTETVVDFSASGGRAFGLIRTYNSATTRASRLGYGWRTNFDRNLISPGPFSAQSKVEIVDGTGASTAFRRTGGVFKLAYWKRSLNYWFYTRKGLNASLVKLANGWEYATETGSVEFFDTEGVLQWIKETDGYQIDFIYDVNGNNVEVEDSFGRKIIMWYDQQGRMQAAFDPDGKVYDYSYTIIGNDFPAGTDPTTTGRNGVLAAVAYPDATPLDDTDNPTVSYHYENPNMPSGLTGMTDENGVRIKTWEYDSQGRGILSEHANGTNRVSISYGLNSATITNALGKQTIVEFENYQDTLRLTAVKGQTSLSCAAADTLYSYDNDGYLDTVTDAKGRITKFTNDNNGRRTQVDAAFGTVDQQSFTASWDPNLPLASTINQPGLQTTYQYSPSNQITSITQTDTTTHTLPYSTNGQTRTWTLNWTSNGQIDTVDGPLSGTADSIDFDYDSAGNLVKFTSEMGHITQITAYTGNGLPLTSIDANGVSTTYTYTPRDWLETYTVHDPYGGSYTTSLSYTIDGRLSGIIPPNGAWVGIWYDNAGRMTGTGNNAGDEIEMVYDDLGGITATRIRDNSNTLRFSFTQVFDELGRVLSSIGANNQTTSFAWNRVDMMSEFTDPNGGNTVQIYDNLDRLKTQTDAISAATTASYGDSGLENVTDPGGLVTAYVRNGWGEIIREVSPDAGITDYELNTNGQIIKRTDARGQITNYTYDAASRLTSEEFVGNSAQNIDYIWDIGGDRGIGRITQIYDEHGITDLLYDARGELYKEIRSQNSQVYETLYADDGTNAVIGMTYPSGRIVEYARDNAGRITDIRTRENANAIWQDALGNMDYLPFGPLTTGTFGNSLALSINYDLDYQITAIKVGAGSIIDLNYNHDANGNITALSDNAIPARDQAFTYDAVDRLVNASGIYGAIGYSYDPTGNRLSRTINNGSIITETYNYATGSNKLITVTGNGGRTIGWNAAGQADIDTKGTDNYLYSHDADGRTRTVTRNGSLIATYGYDAANRRVVKSLTGQIIHYIYGRNDQLIAEYDGISGSVLREYIWLGLMPLAIIDHTNGSPVLNFLHSDHLGRPIAATDTNGLQVWDGTFTPFGEAVLTAGSLSLELRFPGQYRDSETELYYNFTRIYDPSIGRYLQYDTIGLAGGINPFAYVGGNPVGLIDPTGEILIIPIFVGMGIGFGIDLAFQLANNGGKWNCLNKGSLLLSAALGGASGGGGGLFLRNATKKYKPPNTPLEWSHFLPTRLVDKFRSSGIRKFLNDRGGLNGNWVTAKRHHLHDFWRRPKGSKVADKWPLPVQLADRAPTWLKAATLAPLGSQIKRFFQTPQTCECQE